MNPNKLLYMFARKEQQQHQQDRQYGEDFDKQSFQAGMGIGGGI